MDVKVKISKERAEELLAEIQAAFKKINLSKICGFSANQERDDFRESFEKILIQALMVGLVSFNTEKKELTQTLVDPIEIGKEKASILIYKNCDLKAHQLLFLAAQKENAELEKLEALTGTSKKALSELSAFDLEIAGSVAALFLM